MSDTGNFDINSLTPEELQYLQMILMQQGAIGPGAFGGDQGLSMDQTGLDLAGFLSADIPTRNAKGKIEPYELSQEQARHNLVQDLINTSDDPMLAAFGGLGSIGPDAFTPTYDYGEPLNMKGRKLAQSYIGTGGYRGFIAEMILNKGMGADEAAQLAIRTAQGDPNDPTMTDEDRKRMQALKESLPLAKASNNQIITPSVAGGVTDVVKQGVSDERKASIYDEGKVLDDATRLFEGIVTDPSFGYQDEAGNYYAKTPEQAKIKTPMMQAFEKAGLPYMTDQYTDQSYVDRALQAETGRAPDEQQSAQDAYYQQMQQMMDEQTKRREGIKSQTEMLGRLPQPPDMSGVLRQQPPGTTTPAQSLGRMFGQPSATSDMSQVLRQRPPGKMGTPLPPAPTDAFLGPMNASLGSTYGPPSTSPQQPQQPLGTAPANASLGPRQGPTRGSTLGVPDILGSVPDFAGTLGSIWDYVSPFSGDGGGPEPTKRVGYPTPPTNPIYVDAQGNIVMPEAQQFPTPTESGVTPTVAGGRKTTSERARQQGLKTREGTAADRGQVEKQIAAARKAEDEFYKKRSQMLKTDPLNDLIRTNARAQAMSQAGRTPTRDALMQRIMALRAMGLGQG